MAPKARDSAVSPAVRPCLRPRPQQTRARTARRACSARGCTCTRWGRRWKGRRAVLDTIIRSNGLTRQTPLRAPRFGCPPRQWCQPGGCRSGHCRIRARQHRTLRAVDETWQVRRVTPAASCLRRTHTCHSQRDRASRLGKKARRAVLTTIIRPTPQREQTPQDALPGATVNAREARSEPLCARLSRPEHTFGLRRRESKTAPPLRQ
jgi:hypothetical protein